MTLSTKTITSISACVLLMGCSTITTGTTQPFRVVTPGADGAKCTLVDSRAGSWTIAETPGTMEITKGDGPLVVTCTKPGYKTTQATVEEGFAGMTVGNVLLGGGIGIIVDASTGAAQEYPDEIKVWMEPNKWASAEAKEKWMAEKAEYEAKLEAQKAEYEGHKSPDGYNE